MNVKKADWNSTIKGYKNYLLLERSMSSNTIEAYIADVKKLVFFLNEKEEKVSPIEITSQHLTAFISWLNEFGIGATTQARIISGIRGYYKYLLIENMTGSDPTEILETPKLPRKIPDVLSYKEIQFMIAGIDLSHPQGIRNRAILETLYACGLRVTELINLKITHVHEDIGIVKVIGKNDKERIIPIGEEALKYMRMYHEHVRSKMTNIHKDHENILFLNRRGKKLSRVMIFLIVKEAAANVGLTKKVSPHTFRHSFATHLVEGGANLKAVQDMLGHESITTTEIYTHLDTKFLRETILFFHPRNQK